MHGAQSPQSLTWQCTGHKSVLHSRASLSGGQDTPPYSEGVVTNLSRAFVPPSHGALQLLQLPQADTTQCTSHSACVGSPHGAQGAVLHGIVSFKLGQSAPPLLEAMLTVRVRRSVPPPHSTGHPSQSLKLDTVQSTGQMCVLQPRCSERLPQSTPPCATSTTIERERNWVPPGRSGVVHDRVHVDHAPKKDSTQSTRHGCVLHARILCLRQIASLSTNANEQLTPHTLTHSR